MPITNKPPKRWRGDGGGRVAYMDDVSIFHGTFPASEKRKQGRRGILRDITTNPAYTQRVRLSLLRRAGIRYGSRV